MTRISGSTRKQQGITLFGLIVVLAVLGCIGVLVAKVTPTTIEYFSIKKAIASARTAGTTVQEIQSAFNKQAEVGYIDAISGKDLEITKNGDDIQISFAYQKKIPLVGPVSLLIDYAGSTAKS
jgi:type II secretory pathway pseudopilin PulG